MKLPGIVTRMLYQPKVEARSYTDTVREAVNAAALGGQADAAALAAVEACASLIADPLLVATINGARMPLQTLYDMGRDVLRLW